MAKIWKDNNQYKMDTAQTEKPNYYTLEMFLIHLEKYTWDMLEIIL